MWSRSLVIHSAIRVPEEEFEGAENFDTEALSFGIREAYTKFFPVDFPEFLKSVCLKLLGQVHDRENTAFEA